MPPPTPPPKKNQKKNRNEKKKKRKEKEREKQISSWVRVAWCMSRILTWWSLWHCHEQMLALPQNSAGTMCSGAVNKICQNVTINIFDAFHFSIITGKPSYRMKNGI